MAQCLTGAVEARPMWRFEEFKQPNPPAPAARSPQRSRGRAVALLAARKLQEAEARLNLAWFWLARERYDHTEDPHTTAYINIYIYIHEYI